MMNERVLRPGRGAGNPVWTRVYLPDAREVAAGHLAGLYYHRPLADDGMAPASEPYRNAGDAMLAGIGARCARPTPARRPIPEPIDRVIFSAETRAILADPSNLW